MTRLLSAFTLIWLSLVACNSSQIELVAESDEEGANFGRSALNEAIVTLSEARESPSEYKKFADKVSELMPLFNREVKREAELRTCVLALGPLVAGFDLPQTKQMERFATTVWPALLRFPALESEDSQAYVARLCRSELALECNHVVPEYWPVILNARVWRTLKSRIDVAYDRCQWCADDEGFGDILNSSRQHHLQIEALAKDAEEVGRPSAWPVAGKNASPLTTDLIVRFQRDGWVTIRGERATGGDWRRAIEVLQGPDTLLGLHLRPQVAVGDLLVVLSDVHKAGYSSVALVTRQLSFPYDAKQYVLPANTKSFRDLGVHKSDTIQILVQALDLRELKR